jgi:hypothetical protein
VSTALAFAAGPVDISAFVARHATDDPPTTCAIALPLAQYDAVADKIMNRSGMLLDGIEYVTLPCGLVLPLQDLFLVEAEALLREPVTDGLAALVDDTEPAHSAERDTRPCPMSWEVMPPSVVSIDLPPARNAECP